VVIINRMSAQVYPVDALLVIDMQNSFCHPDEVMYDGLGEPMFEIGQTVKATAAAVAAARAARVPVVFTRHQYQAGHADFAAPCSPSSASCSGPGRACSPAAGT
jgi:nicotinamidase-related amidase